MVKMTELRLKLRSKLREFASMKEEDEPCGCEIEHYWFNRNGVQYTATFHFDTKEDLNDMGTFFYRGTNRITIEEFKSVI